MGSWFLVMVLVSNPSLHILIHDEGMPYVICEKMAEYFINYTNIYQELYCVGKHPAFEGALLEIK